MVCPTKGTLPCRRQFLEAAKKAYGEDDQAHGKVLQLLAEACSMMLFPEKRNDPIHPGMDIWGNVFRNHRRLHRGRDTILQQDH